ncbi:unnamed protein product [Hymenolepis diminuta]|uniref:Uncharacterized protein n=1 Tax=Hymenolepis diminuta TaxID=6216 RepID=A0A564YYV7_HYMDI|nr:unnamed protein product [Hymenolepis diminuta]
MFSPGLTKVTNLKLSSFSINENARLSAIGYYASSHLLSSSARSPLYLCLSLSLTRFNPCCGLLEYTFGLTNPQWSAPRLLIALTQTATNW